MLLFRKKRFFMRILILLLALGLAAPACAADSAQTPPAAQKQDNAKPEDDGKAEAKEGEYSCKYYSVQLPDGWKAIIPPTDQHGTTNAIFAATAGTSVVTMIIGPNGGEDAQTIATMFAEQFKATNPPALKNGQYTFAFKSQNVAAQAYVATQDKEFMVTTIMGNQRAGKNFLNKNVSTKDWKDLLPK